ncbi:MAG: hypothetical protein ACJAZ2_001166 [Glaciecola sp.]|jgi:hypothetical protein
MKKKFKYLLGTVVALLVLSFLLIYLLASSHEEVFPNKDAVNYNYGFYHEDIEKDWSTVNLDSSNQTFKMTYKLSRATRNPFVAGFIVKNDSVKTLANYSKHNMFRIHLKSNAGMRIPIMLTFSYKEGEKKKNGKAFPMLTLLKFVDYNEPGYYDISLDEFTIPDWWYRVHRLHRDEVDMAKVTYVRGVIIGSCSLLRENITDSIEVESIAFYSDNSTLYLTTFIVLLLLTAISLVVLFRKKVRIRQW